MVFGANRSFFESESAIFSFQIVNCSLCSFLNSDLERIAPVAPYVKSFGAKSNGSNSILGIKGDIKGKSSEKHGENS